MVKCFIYLESTWLMFVYHLELLPSVNVELPPLMLEYMTLPGISLESGECFIKIKMTWSHLCGCQYSS